MTEHLDVVIVGAGISGVSAAWHLQDRCPTKSYAILEKRESMGGTWDLFRYPGIRSDSDMYTLGFRFRPWTGRQAIADGKPILEYVKSTAAMYGIDRHIRFHHKVISADWSTAENRWTVHIQSHGTLSARAGPSGPPRCHPAATRSPSGPSGAALRACAPRPRRPPTDR